MSLSDLAISLSAALRIALTSLSSVMLFVLAVGPFPCGLVHKKWGPPFNQLRRATFCSIERSNLTIRE